MSGIQMMLLGAVAQAAASSPVYQSSTTASKSTGTDLTINIPTSTAAGDLLIAVLVANQTAGWNQATGWTRLVNSITDPSTSLQYKIADGTEGATQVFVGASIRASGTVMRFTNATSTYVSTVQTGSASSQTAPSVTITADNSLVLSVFTADASAQTWTDTRTNPIVSFGTQCSFDVSYDEVDAGATGTDTSTMSSSDTYACFQIGISNVAQVEYITNVSDTTDASTYTFTGVNIGGPGLIVVNLHGGQGTGTAWTVSSCTIGGVSATIHVNPSDPDSCAIASAVITSGTTADISFTATTTLLRAVVGVYRITGYQSATPVATASQTTNASTDTRTVTLDTSANGVVIAGTSHADSSTFTWTNATENYDVTLAETSNSFAGASVNTTGGNLTITVVSTDAAPANGYTLSAVSWR